MTLLDTFPGTSAPLLPALQPCYKVYKMGNEECTELSAAGRDYHKNKIFSPVYFSHSFLPHHRQYIFKYLNINTIKIPILFDITNNIFNGI